MTRRHTSSMSRRTGIEVTIVTWGMWTALLLAGLANHLPYLVVACLAFAVLALACRRQRRR